MESLEGEELDLNWVCCLLDDIPSTCDSIALHSSLPCLNPLLSSASRSAGTTQDSSEGLDGITEESCRKRFRVGSTVTSSSKACREKQRRDHVNKRFVELSELLKLQMTPKLDKAAIITDAIRTMKLLRQESSSLTSQNEGLRQSINEIKAEKNVLRTEKRRLKSEKDEMEKRLKGLDARSSMQIHPALFPASYTVASQAEVGSKLMPLVNYPSVPVPLWQFIPQASIDTSHDHVLCPPVA